MMTMTWNDKLMMITTWNDDKLKQLTASKGLSEEAKAAVCMFMNCLRFNEIEPEEIHVCFDDDGVLHKWNQFEITIPAAYADMDEKARVDFINEEVYKRLGEKDYFYNLPCQQAMMDFAYMLHELGVDVKVISCSIDAYTDMQKYKALSEQMPWLDKKDIYLLPDGRGKMKYLYLPEDIREAMDDITILIDDHTPNCRGFNYYGDSHNTLAIKCINDINGNGKNGSKSWKGLTLPYNDIGTAFYSLREGVDAVMKEREKERKEKEQEQLDNDTCDTYDR